MQYLKVFIMGSFFGIILTKAQVISWFKIRDMFYFREPDLYLIIGSAVATAMLSLFFIRRFGLKTVDGQIPVITKKTLDKGKFIGGFIFGLGWFLAGTCPGPIYAQIGVGEYFAFFTLLGALLGVSVFGYIGAKLPR